MNTDFANFVNLTPEEKLVYDVIKIGKQTQVEIARRLRWLGGTEFDPIKNDSTTLRKIRKLIHDLRTKGIPVISDKQGYKIVDSREEKLEYLNMSIRKEAVRIKNARAYHEKLMKEWGVSENELQLNLELK